MNGYTLAITKTIVVTVEAADFVSAKMEIENDFSMGEYEHSWSREESRFEIIEKQEK